FNVDTKLFSAFTQVIFILKCLSDGQTKHQIIYDKFNGDRQRVSKWRFSHRDAVAKRKYRWSIRNNRMGKNMDK
ncbi:MAG TPA: hypothetical protein VE076_06700, partial [Nitrososphaeraceae archaeon]|nr:hypothetical protein [Nitrososphaeraceae archaeon]